MVANSDTLRPSRLLIAMICSAALSAWKLIENLAAAGEKTTSGALVVVRAEMAGFMAPVPSTIPGPTRAALETSMLDLIDFKIELPFTIVIEMAEIVPAAKGGELAAR
jgi:hypothetical protein